MRAFFNNSKDEPTANNFKAIYDKVQKASSLLRSRSNERKRSAVKQYELNLSRNNFGNTCNLNDLTLEKVSINKLI